MNCYFSSYAVFYLYEKINFSCKLVLCILFQFNWDINDVFSIEVIIFVNWTCITYKVHMNRVKLGGSRESHVSQVPGTEGEGNTK